MNHDIRIWASCEDCGWVGHKFHRFDPTSRWQRHLVVRLASTTYWLHLLVGTRHTHWDWSR